MLFTLTILGSGTSVPSPGRRASAYTILAEDTQILMDCGSGALGSLVNAGGSLADLTGVLLSHLHLDHTADLVSLLFALKNPAGPRRTSPLPIWGPSGTAQHLEALKGVYEEWIEPPDCEVMVMELQPGHPLEVGPLAITPYEVEHLDQSLAFRVERQGASICYSGDTGPCAGLEAAAKGVDVLICECALLEDEEAPGHLTATEVGRVAELAGVGQVILTHLYERVVETDPVQRVKEHFDGPIWLGQDGMSLALDSEGGIAFRIP